MTIIHQDVTNINSSPPGGHPLPRRAPGNRRSEAGGEGGQRRTGRHHSAEQVAMENASEGV